MSIFDQLSGGPSRAEEQHSGGKICSRKGCRDGAAWQLLWNNPRIHTPERRKIWLACTAHREWLEEYLTLRGLWRQTLPLPGAAGGEGGD
ncbi:hypothetical protein [Arthrobacter mobilis]|uniref:Acetone carboxylase n=1 Tax=Arthrobacter mobilis TaxID=2724944 RepID=A0A7X6K344_9MICC|nr:hypothetical protein [Arthrobacter mobilis]NKX53887.1 hypothetical protein [Arthrobacter mobilis]